MKKLTVELLEWEVRLMLRAMAELEAAWAKRCATSGDEDEVAEYGNDLTELRIAKESFEDKATAAFGTDVTTFDRTPL